MTDACPSLIWSAMPIELVLAVPDDSAARSVEMVVEGRLLQVIPQGNGQGMVERLISSDAQDYLDQRWQPGALVNMTVSK